MTTLLIAPQMQNISSTKPQIEQLIEGLMASLPDPKGLTHEERRGIIARYSAVLEGNFIYWMTAKPHPLVQAEEARPIRPNNPREEIVDCHPAMLRRFTVAADSFPKDTDALAVNDELTNVRLFLGRMSGVKNLLTMAFFEGFIQRFMPYLADLAEARARRNGNTPTCTVYVISLTRRVCSAPFRRRWKSIHLSRRLTSLKVWISCAR